jgi:D-alanine-D-alanine ligase
MGNRRPVVLPVTEIAYELLPGMPRLLTFAAKWEPDSEYYKGTKPVCPAKINENEREYVAGTALAAFRLVVKRGYARVDMRMDEAGKLYVIEVNPNPDISPGAGAALQSAAAGMGYAEFIGELVKLATGG